MECINIIECINTIECIFGAVISVASFKKQHFINWGKKELHRHETSSFGVLKF